MVPAGEVTGRMPVPLCEGAGGRGQRQDARATLDMRSGLFGVMGSGRGDGVAVFIAFGAAGAGPAAPERCTKTQTSSVVRGQWVLRRCGEGLGWREVPKETGLFGSFQRDRTLRLFGWGSEPRMARTDTNEFSNGRRVGSRERGLVDRALRGHGARSWVLLDRALGGDFRGGPEWR